MTHYGSWNLYREVLTWWWTKNIWGGGGWEQGKTESQRHYPSDPLSLIEPHLLKFPEPSNIGPTSEDQVDQHGSLS